MGAAGPALSPPWPRRFSTSIPPELRLTSIRDNRRSRSFQRIDFIRPIRAEDRPTSSLFLYGSDPVLGEKQLRKRRRILLKPWGHPTRARLGLTAWGGIDPTQTRQDPRSVLAADGAWAALLEGPGAASWAPRGAVPEPAAKREQGAPAVAVKRDPSEATHAAAQLDKV